jgi:hypothetical protein
VKSVVRVLRKRLNLTLVRSQKKSVTTLSRFALAVRSASTSAPWTFEPAPSSSPEGGEAPGQMTEWLRSGLQNRVQGFDSPSGLTTPSHMRSNSYA